MIELIKEYLSIPSPTFQENAITNWTKTWIATQLPTATIQESNNSLIITFPPIENKPHIALVGHSDVVPDFFDLTETDTHIHAAGASDMKSACAIYLHTLKNHLEEFQKHYNVSLVIYAREEGTPLKDNGLYDLIQTFPDYFKTIDCAIVGEPTDNTIQLGCVGSIHATVKIAGKACHSARPWQGENALYNALPFITSLSKFEGKTFETHNVSFQDTLSITESESEKGRTTIPGQWQCNVNFRFTPAYTLEKAKNHLTQILQAAGAKDIEISDAVPAASIIETPLFNSLLEKIDQPIQAKQAWTDVAQLTALNIPAFNFGPGSTDQAHKPNEYILKENIEKYAAILHNVLCK